ncbi:MAG: DUF3014 domain-containing protein [Betaproteobacteria bacterium]|nr:DUF3014 domain-containing protein [Betaproteobacteria bacterium]
MRRTAWWVLLIVILGSGAAAYYYWQQGRQQPLPPQPSKTAAPPAPAAAAPVILHPLETSEVQPLPSLGESDAAMREALAELLVRMMPVKPVPPLFARAGTQDNMVISPGNSTRYAAYVTIAQAVDARKLVDVYIRLYPLFQRAYEELGFPKAYFNDRLVETLDHLLDAPDIKGPIKLTQPKVMYEFADPALEARSAGQKIMIRMGSENAAKVKAKLREIRHEVTRRELKSKRP